MKPPPEDLVPVRVPAKRRHPVTDTNGSKSYLGVCRAEPATATQADEVFQQAFDGSTPDAVFQRLLGSVDILDFQATYWERECLQVASAVDDVAHLQHVFPWQDLYSGDTQMKDVFSGQVECYKMRLPSLSKVPFLPGLCKNGSIMCMLLRRGFCITVNEPEGTKMGLLWRLIENLEAYFENIVHCLLVMTPTGSYCHHDEQDANKETFVLMLHGRMKWTLTHRGDGKQNIADDPTQDPVRKTFDMKAGDVLYVPNCYTRTAVDLADYDDGKASSVHVILSVRKDNNWSQYMEAVFPKLMHAAQKLDPVFRSPLPRDFLNITSADNPSCTPASTMVAQMLRKMADAIEYNPKMWDARNFSAPKVLQKFMSNRLPPHNFDGEELDRVLSVEPPLLTMQSRVRLKFPHHTMFLEQSPRDRNRPINASGGSDADGAGSDGDDDDDGSREGGGAESPMMDAPAAQAAEDFPFPVGVGGDGDEADDAGNVYAPPAGDDDGSDSDSVSDDGTEGSGTEIDSTSDVDSVGAEMADNALVLYTSCFNDVRARWRSKHLRRMKPFVTSSAYAPALAYLKKAGTNYVAVYELPVVGDSDSLRERIVADLYAGGLIDLLVDPGAFDVHYERKKQDSTAKKSKVYGGKSRKDSSSSDLDVD